MTGRELYRRLRQSLRLGPSRRELRDLAEARALRVGKLAQDNIDLRNKLRHAQVEITGLRKEVGLLHQRMADLPSLLVEPPEVDGCTKTRFHTRAEAEEFLVRLAARTGGDPAMLRVYTCRVCPRHPAMTTRFLHVGHATTEEGQKQQAKARKAARSAAKRASQSGTRIGDRLDPEILKRLQH